ncbi:unnamed protein product, partial [Meganyctiphanes norvegica]
LNSSKTTITFLNLESNNLKQFPFEILKGFPNLKQFTISSNPLETVPVDAFNGLVSLEILTLDHINAIFEIGIFNNLLNLVSLGLRYNDLHSIPASLFTTGSKNLQYIGLIGDGIEEIEPNAFEAVDGLCIDLDSNSLTVLEEDVWRPLLEAGVELVLYQNPLVCDCSIAWLIQNPPLHSSFNRATCHDGSLIQDLDPEDFAECF